MYDFSTCGEGGEDKSSMPDLSISKITKKKTYKFNHIYQYVCHLE